MAISDTRKATFTITLNVSGAATATVDYATVDNTAVAETDYAPVSGTLTFAPGETTKTVDVFLDEETSGGKEFLLVLSNPSNCTLGSFSGTCTIGVGTFVSYDDRFRWMYDKLHEPANGYFGPQTGANPRVIPRHISALDSKIINEAPDYGGESVSETASFWVGLEAWKGALDQDWTGYANCWNKIEQYYIPSAVNQPIAVYNPESPADYVPEGTHPSMYPRLSQPSAPKGVDPLATELETTYGNLQVYLMHWIIDVEGEYGFYNGDGATKCVFINTYERGLQESSFETITHPCWGNWANGGNSQFGYEPLYTQGKQLHPAAQFDYSKKWSYTCAPDSEVRAIQWAFWAKKFATAQGVGSTISTHTNRARKLGDYLRYALFDKYFREIGNNQVGALFDNEGSYKSCHFLINWYAAWGGEIPATGMEGTWSYRIGCSECHQGYQGVDTAYFLATGGGGMAPQSASGGDIWLGSVYRQMEMIRWLQSPEGPIAGGVTNSWTAQYLTPTDGRNEAGKFYGMVYTYSPVWHDPPSNNWVGFQAWGQGRTADLFLEVADKTGELANICRLNCEVILDRLVGWFLRESELLENGSYSLPGTVRWVETAEVPGQTTHSPNLEGVYEYLPMNSWDGTGSHADFWNAANVPNPTLHCFVVDRGADLGVAASFSYLLIAYAQAKRLMGKFDTTIPNSTFKPRDAYLLAKEILDRTWNLYRDELGICIPEPRLDYNRMNDSSHVPASFTGTMPNGEPINSSSTFISTRTFLKSDPMWPACEAYLNGTGPAPIFTYHRFWAQAEFAISNAAMHHYFGDIATS